MLSALERARTTRPGSEDRRPSPYPGIFCRHGPIAEIESVGFGIGLALEGRALSRRIGVEDHLARSSRERHRTGSVAQLGF